MTEPTDELRGSTPVMSAKDMLTELRTDFRRFLDVDFKEVRDEVHTIAAQDLKTRMDHADNQIDRLNSWHDRMVGLTWAGAVLGFIGTALGVILMVTRLSAP